ncbi:3-mercaptopyruvate sulfurtransferase [Streptomyces agglomeratus]|uniref:3-mercaptopyruvate sulfurtransferase n=1 Tax=Streptomyces agglomeratus TaxID=285458 RepID=A0A1E5P524_9ACTN|nr:sulfurtransferase [Streptomyces agglomeratus]OEJ24625.1 3-mercaptopyruvate sulfurtransferase [Streptomyces agglomeratus]OEJ41425.1 3-mercaptopyruvate sulfurtransferase [Streptomyces agglomeratus]OEJ44198.1 3-mercaptopyruvate sulfurtransferase [Streptomyces agglomeratus]OEJ53913.1 3-mercaptopyruvate sulfurtransferase [Streptomyces agglomeratus]OEJ61292.1 3-mercaptopyruvate sulfurtransferase [Streptomyces agglomeratus]
MNAIITAAELADELAGDRPPVLLDVRYQMGGPHGRAAYEEGHIPGAVFVDLEAELADPPGPGGRHPLPGVETFGAVMRRAGVRGDTPVVVYDGGQGWAAARAWWMLRWTGHPDVRVLDGGLAVWTGPVESDVPEPAPGDFRPVPGAVPLLDADGAAALARTGLLLDARAAERYRGEVEPIDPVAGHIPGAVSAPTTENVGPDGRLLPASELAARFKSLGAGEDRPVGVYCGSGVSAAQQVLALDVAGIPAALYVGSWSEWITDTSRPVATGAEPR